MLPFARPGSVVIIVHPYNFRVPDWKLMGYYAGLRVLELVTLNVSYSIGNEANPVWVKVGRIFFVTKRTLERLTFGQSFKCSLCNNTKIQLSSFTHVLIEWSDTKCINNSFQGVYAYIMQSSYQRKRHFCSAVHV